MPLACRHRPGPTVPCLSPSRWAGASGDGRRTRWWCAHRSGRCPRLDVASWPAWERCASCSAPPPPCRCCGGRSCPHLRCRTGRGRCSSCPATEGPPPGCRSSPDGCVRLVSAAACRARGPPPAARVRWPARPTRRCGRGWSATGRPAAAAVHRRPPRRGDVRDAPRRPALHYGPAVRPAPVRPGPLREAGGRRRGQHPRRHAVVGVPGPRVVTVHDGVGLRGQGQRVDAELRRPPSPGTQTGRPADQLREVLQRSRVGEHQIASRLAVPAEGSCGGRAATALGSSASTPTRTRTTHHRHPGTRTTSP